MWLKIIIIILFLAILVSLSSAFLFLFRGVGSKSKHTLYALGIRVALASLLLACVFYGLYTGQLGSTAPWDAGPERSQTSTQGSNAPALKTAVPLAQNVDKQK